MTTPGAVTVINTIEPQNDGAFPVVADTDVKGGHHAVADTTARDAIPDHLLTVGMTVGVADGTVYVLTSLDPKTWAAVPDGLEAHDVDAISRLRQGFAEGAPVAGVLTVNMQSPTQQKNILCLFDVPTSVIILDDTSTLESDDDIDNELWFFMGSSLSALDSFQFEAGKGLSDVSWLTADPTATAPAAFGGGLIHIRRVGLGLVGWFYPGIAQGPAWGEITGTLANQTDLQAALDSLSFLVQNADDAAQAAADAAFEVEADLLLIAPWADGDTNNSPDIPLGLSETRQRRFSVNGAVAVTSSTHEYTAQAQVVLNNTTGSPVSLSLPAWRFVGGDPPQTIGANGSIWLRLFVARGTADADSVDAEVVGASFRDGITVPGSNTIVASFAADSKRVQTRDADGAVTVDGTGYAAQIDVDIQITNTTGSAIAVSVLGAWALIGDAVTEIPAGETLHVTALSRGTVEGDVSYAMGLAVSP